MSESERTQPPTLPCGICIALGSIKDQSQATYETGLLSGWALRGAALRHGVIGDANKAMCERHALTIGALAGIFDAQMERLTK